MSKVLFPIALFLVCCLPIVQAQVVKNVSDCKSDTCECIGDFFSELEVYYFGDNNVKVEAYSDRGKTKLIQTFNGVNNGQLLTINAAGLPDGVLGTYTYLKWTDAGGATCTTEIYSRCPINAWPGALDDLSILGKTYGFFTVFAHTTAVNKLRCTVDNITQDWHVGGNVVGPIKNTLGTRNDQNMVLISSDLKRGILTKDGKFGLNTQTPAATLDVNGDVRIESTLDVNGIARMNNTATSTSPANGALIVKGGAGIGENLNVGNAAKVNGSASSTSTTTGALVVTGGAGIGENLNVGNTAKVNGATSSTSTTTGALVVAGGAGIGENLNVGSTAKVNGTTSSTSTTTGALVVAGGAGIGENLNVGSAAKVNGTTSSTSATTGALVVAGGAGVGENLNVGNTLKVNGTTASTNATTGALVVAGGSGVAGNLNVGGESTLTGKVRIATTDSPGGHELYVGGSIIAEEVMVKLRPNWPDYVFDPKYPTPDLQAWKKYIAENQHLPGFPSAKQIEAQGGVELGETQRLLVEKVEQLLLIILEQQKQIDALQKAIQQPKGKE
jgi:hypothetical protein